MGTAAVLLTHIAVPLAIPIMASVTRNEGIPTRVVKRPLTMPTTIPVRSPQNIPPIRPNLANASAVVTEARPATEPIDRSISPADRTKVMPTAMMAIIAVWRTIFSKLFGSRNPLSLRVIEKKMKIATNPA